MQKEFSLEEKCWIGALGFPLFASFDELPQDQQRFFQQQKEDVFFMKKEKQKRKVKALSLTPCASFPFDLNQGISNVLILHLDCGHDVIYRYTSSWKNSRENSFLYCVSLGRCRLVLFCPT